jgi:hypothetical protein
VVLFAMPALLLGIHLLAERRETVAEREE